MLLAPGTSEYSHYGNLNINEMRNNSELIKNGTLRHEDWIKWDQRMIDIARQRLTAIQDLIDFGLAREDFDLGDILSNYEKLSDMTKANIDMDGGTPGQRDRLTFTPAGVPIPIFHKEFQLNQRQILSSMRRPGGNLPTTHMTTATRIVMDGVEDMAFNGVPSIVIDGAQVFGYTNHPNRNTLTITNAWGGGSETPVADVLAMLQAAYDDNFFGPFVLYVSKDNWGFIQDDYNAVKGEKTFKERFEAFSDISAVRPGDSLSDGELVLVQMTEDVVDLAVAQNVVNFEEPQVKRMQHDFTVMAAMAIRVKSDKDGRSGVVHSTGA